MGLDGGVEIREDGLPKIAGRAMVEERVMTPTGETPQGGLFATWGLIEWIIGALWTAGLAIAGFVWRQSGKIDMLESRLVVLEREAQLREKMDDARHKENVHILRGLQFGLQGLAARIDKIYER